MKLSDCYPGSVVRNMAVPMTNQWSAFNPSIATDDLGQFWCIIRQSNYVMDRHGRYQTFDDDGVIRTRNLLARLSDKLDVLDLTMVDDSFVANTAATFPVRGLEDARLVYWRGNWHMVGTVREQVVEAGEESGIARMAVDLVSSSGMVVSRKILKPPSPVIYEKNWTPVTFRPETYVYSVEPFKTVSGSGWPSWDTDIPIPEVRGSSQLVPWGVHKGMTIVHKVEWGDYARRAYYHAFVSVDMDTGQTTFGPWFSFIEKGIEFCAGLVYDHARHRFVASFGRGDWAACLAEIPAEPVLESLTDQ